MDEIELGVLQACREYASRQHEMLPLLAATVGEEESQIFDAWILRKWAQRGKLVDEAWAYFFHGWECDLKNLHDGRFLRIDFGPRGRVGILNDGGVVRFIMTSVSPWLEFPTLKSYFAKNGPPFDEFSVKWEKMWDVWARLESRGFFEPADLGLVALQAKYTTRGSDGLNHVWFPPEISEETRADCMVAHRQQLSQEAICFLTAHPLNEKSGVEPNDAKTLPVASK